MGFQWRNTMFFALINQWNIFSQKAKFFLTGFLLVSLFILFSSPAFATLLDNLSITAIGDETISTGSTYTSSTPTATLGTESLSNIPPLPAGNGLSQLKETNANGGCINCHANVETRIETYFTTPSECSDWNDIAQERACWQDLIDQMDSFGGSWNASQGTLMVDYLSNDNDAATTVWSLTENPSGMTIDSATGVVTWTTPTVGDHTITIKAVNDHREDTESWTLTVELAGSLSVTPVTDYNPTGVEGGPFTPASIIYTLENVGGVSINYSVSKTQTWLDLDDNGGTLAAGASTQVTASINANANSLSPGSSPYSDTITFTDTTNSDTQTRKATLTVNAKAAGVLTVTPATDLNSSGLEGGAFNPNSQTYFVANTGTGSLDYTVSKNEAWTTLTDNGTGTLSSPENEGRILVTGSYFPNRGEFHAALDDSVGGSLFSLNEMILNIDLAGQSDVDLTFFHKEFVDEDHKMSTSFIGSENSDGVAISEDGINWSRVENLTGANISSDYKQFEVDLDEAAASAGISFNSNFKIKFQQYDDFGIDDSSDGFTFDDIEVRPGDVASFPFFDGFERGFLASYWATSSSNEGRILVTDSDFPNTGTYHITMDDSVDASSNSLNELVLTIDLSNQNDVELSFFHKEFGDENHIMSTSFTGSENTDGVAISEDGTTWHKVQGLTSVDGITSGYQKFTVDLDAAASTAGISFNSSFQIKFQQYDNYGINTDGFAFDDIELKPGASVAPFPFVEDFESGVLDSFWASNSTNGGSIKIGTGNTPNGGIRHITLSDSSASLADSAINELVLNIDLTGQKDVVLSFFHKIFGNESDDVMSASFTGTEASDGVAISADGNTWHKIQGLTSLDGTSTNYKQFFVDLDAAASNAGISFNSAFQIKFQQFDFAHIPDSGFAFDDIELKPGGSVASFPFYEGFESSFFSSFWTTNSTNADANTTVMVEINSQADSLAVGPYSDTITFTNTDDASIVTRNVNLEVKGLDVLTVTSDNFLPTGSEGGAFSPASKSYTLENTGGTSINYSVSNSESWVTVTDNGTGTLSAGATTTVDVTINNTANSLSSGASPFFDVIVFTDTTNNVSHNRGVVLTVASLGSLDVSPITDFDPVGVAGGDFPLTMDYTLTNNGGTSLDYSVTKNETWLTLSGSTSGTLAPGANTVIAASINSGETTNLDTAQSPFIDSITFQDTTNNITIARNVNLTISTTPITFDLLDTLTISDMADDSLVQGLAFLSQQPETTTTSGLDLPSGNGLAELTTNCVSCHSSPTIAEKILDVYNNGTNRALPNHTLGDRCTTRTCWQDIMDDMENEGGSWSAGDEILMVDYLSNDKGTATIWSLESGPADMIIDSSTGVVIWPEPTVGTQEITIKAVKDHRDDTASFSLTVVSPVISVQPNLLNLVFIAPLGDVSITTDSVFTSLIPSIIVLDGTELPPGPGLAELKSNCASCHSAPDPTVSEVILEVHANGTTRALPNHTLGDKCMTRACWQDIIDDMVAEGGSWSAGDGVLMVDYLANDKGTATVWSLVSGPDGMTIDSTTGVVSWATPKPGIHSVTIKAVTDHREDTETFVITATRPVVKNPDLLDTLVIAGFSDTTENAFTTAPFQSATPSADTITGTELPPGDGLAEVNTNCTSCHGTEKILEVHSNGTTLALPNHNQGDKCKTRTCWQDIVDAMVDNGGTWSTEVGTLIVDYLSNDKDTATVWSLESGPAEMTIDSTTGVINWASPTEGTHSITVKAVKDNREATASFSLEVSDAIATESFDVLNALLVFGLTDSTFSEHFAYSSITPVLGIAPGADLPPGNGQAEVESFCTFCHSTQNILNVRQGAWTLKSSNALTEAIKSHVGKPCKTRACWSAIVNEMKAKGGTWDSPEGVLIEDYLANDQGGSPIWTLESGPAGMVVDPSTGRVTWPNPTAGTHNVTVKVELDHRSATTTFTLTPADQTITITNGPTANPETVNPRSPVVLSVTAEDSAGRPLGYTWNANCLSWGGGNNGFVGFGPSTLWPAPDNTTGIIQTCTLSVDVTNDMLAFATGSVDVQIGPNIGFINNPNITIDKRPFNPSCFLGRCNQSQSKFSITNNFDAQKIFGVTPISTWFNVDPNPQITDHPVSLDVAIRHDLAPVQADTVPVTLDPGQTATFTMVINAGIGNLENGIHSTSVKVTDQGTGEELGTVALDLTLMPDPFQTAKKNRVISPYWQADNATYTFIAVTHPGLQDISSEVGLVMNAVQSDQAPFGPAAEFTVSANSTRRVFIVGTNNPVINPATVPNAEFIVGTTSGKHGQLAIAAKASNTETIQNSGYPDITMLNFWGAVVVQATSTGFAMEFVGDAQDSRALNQPQFSGVN